MPPGSHCQMILSERLRLRQIMGEAELGLVEQYVESVTIADVTDNQVSCVPYQDDTLLAGRSISLSPSTQRRPEPDPGQPADHSPPARHANQFQGEIGQRRGVGCVPGNRVGIEVDGRREPWPYARTGSRGAPPPHSAEQCNPLRRLANRGTRRTAPLAG